MIILDTCVLIFDALNPEKLSRTAKKAISNAEKENLLYCCDISLWEIAMLVQKNRIDPGTDTETFIELILQSKCIEVLSITPQTAALSTTLVSPKHYDPADRLIAATALYHNASLVTIDEKLQKIPKLMTVW